MSDKNARPADAGLSITHVNRVYDDGEGNVTQALEDVSFDVRPGEFVSLIGHSGCGKTTLLRLIAGLDAPQSGELSLGGQPISGTSPDRGYVFQQGSLFPWLTVRQNIAFGLKARGRFRERSAEVDEYVHLIGLDGFGDAYPHQISGGMAQRVAIARSLINDPRLLLLDEPMGALDSFTRADLQDKLLDLWEKRGTTMVLVTHDVDEAIYLSDRIVLMTPRPGRVSEVIPVDIDRPRDRTAPEFLELRASILEKLHLASAEEEAAFAAQGVQAPVTAGAGVEDGDAPGALAGLGSWLSGLGRRPARDARRPGTRRVAA